MRAQSILLAASLLSLGALGFASGCSSSSSGSGTVPDAASSDDSGSDGGGTPSNGCSPVMGSMCTPGMGLTCCINTANLTGAVGGGGGGANIGTCEPAANCTSMIQYQCMVPTDCATGQVCCGGVGGDAGALIAALADAGDASFDAAALAAADGGLGGIGSALTGLQVESFCQSSCMAPQYQLCASDADCKSAGANSVCGPASLAALGAAGGGGITSLLSSFIMIKTCQAPEGGTTTEGGTSTEAGGSEDSGSIEGGGSNEAGATDASGG